MIPVIHELHRADCYTVTIPVVVIEDVMVIFKRHVDFLCYVLLLQYFADVVVLFQFTKVYCVLKKMKIYHRMLK